MGAGAGDEEEGLGPHPQGQDELHRPPGARWRPPPGGGRRRPDPAGLPRREGREGPASGTPSLCVMIKQEGAAGVSTGSEELHLDKFYNLAIRRKMQERKSDE